MSQNQVKVITKKQAQHQIAVFGRALVIYLLLFLALRVGLPYLERYAPQIFFGYDAETFELIVSIIITIFVTVFLFRHANRRLKLQIKDYLKSPHLPFSKIFAISCIGIGIYLISTSVSSLFYFFFHTNQLIYPYLGNFSSQTAILKNVLYFCLFVIIKPICDEYIFRGIIQRQLGHYGRYFGVLGSALLYAIAQPNLVRAIPAFFVGWYLALITMRYHSIRPGFLVHVLIHLFAWILDIVPGNFMWVVLIAILLIYIIAALSIFQKRVDTHMVRYGATEWKLWKILLTTPSIILCFIIFIANVVLSLT